MNQDRNLLFGVFAVQLMKLTSAQLVDAAGAWAVDQSRSLPQQLLQAKWITPEDVAFINDVVDRAMADNGNDPRATLAAFGGADKVRQTFRGSLVLHEHGAVSAPTDDMPVWAATEGPTGIVEADGRYTLLSEHAHGGMGRILLVYDDHLGREVALKELYPRGFAGTWPDGNGNGRQGVSPIPVHLISRFLQEAKITGQLEHPSIVPVHEIGHRLDGALYYTMRFVRGQTLSRAIHEAGSLEGRLGLLTHFVDLCQAIAYAHSRYVVHRDIKPDNVMIGEFGETVVLDWGLAKIRGKADPSSDAMASTIHTLRHAVDASGKTADGAIMGTPDYMPPEQARGQLDLVDERSDVYSLGVVLYELLTGQRLFTGRSVREILQKVLEEQPVPVLQVEKNAPPELAAICARAIDKDRSNRYDSARDLAHEIERFMQGRFVEAYRYGARERVRRFTRKNLPVLLTAVLAIGVAFALFAVIDTFLQRQSLKMEVTASARELIPDLTTAATLMDTEDAGATLKSLASDNRVLGACVLTPDNPRFAVYEKDGVQNLTWPTDAPDAGFVFQQDRLLVVTDLSWQGTEIGTLMTVHDADSLNQRIGLLFTVFLALALPILLAAAALLLWARGGRRPYATRTAR